jgi:hypothetical protein
MKIFNEILFVYGMTFIISMFVALIIKILAGMIQFIPEGNFSLSTLFTAFTQNFHSKIEGNKKLIHDFKNTRGGINDELLSFYHERD